MSPNGRTWIALLRGINVGKAKRVAMSDLRAVMEQLGYLDVRTLLASGNVVFRSVSTPGKVAAAAMQAALERKTGVSSRFTLLAAEDLRSMIAGNPLADACTNPSRLMVGFLQHESHLRLVKDLVGQDWSPDSLAPGPQSFYAWLPRGSMESRLFQVLSKKLGDNVTVRNWSTTLKLGEMAATVSHLLPVAKPSLREVSVGNADTRASRGSRARGPTRRKR